MAPMGFGGYGGGYGGYGGGYGPPPSRQAPVNIKVDGGAGSDRRRSGLQDVLLFLFIAAIIAYILYSMDVFGEEEFRYLPKAPIYVPSINVNNGDGDTRSPDSGKSLSTRGTAILIVLGAAVATMLSMLGYSVYKIVEKGDEDGGQQDDEEGEEEEEEEEEEEDLVPSLSDRQVEDLLRQDSDFQAFAYWRTLGQDQTKIMDKALWNEVLRRYIEAANAKAERDLAANVTSTMAYGEIFDRILKAYTAEGGSIKPDAVKEGYAIAAEFVYLANISIGMDPTKAEEDAMVVARRHGVEALAEQRIKRHVKRAEREMGFAELAKHLELLEADFKDDAKKGIKKAIRGLGLSRDVTKDVLQQLNTDFAKLKNLRDDVKVLETALDAKLKDLTKGPSVDDLQAEFDRIRMVASAMPHLQLKTLEILEKLDKVKKKSALRDIEQTMRAVAGTSAAEIEKASDAMYDKYEGVLTEGEITDEMLKHVSPPPPPGGAGGQQGGQGSGQVP